MYSTTNARMPKGIGFKMGRQGEKVMAHARSNSTIIHVQLQCVTRWSTCTHQLIPFTCTINRPLPLSLSLRFTRWKRTFWQLFHAKQSRWMYKCPTTLASDSWKRILQAANQRMCCVVGWEKLSFSFSIFTRPLCLVRAIQFFL
jgi:hypothetical protein